MPPRKNEMSELRGETRMIRRVFFVFLVAALAGCSSAPDNQKAEPQVGPAPTAAAPAAQDDAKWTVTEGNKLTVAGWGKPEADFTTKVPGRLFSLDLKTKKKTLITPEPFGNIDGIESDGQGGYVVSDYMAGKIMRVGADGKSTVVKQLK